MLSELKNILKKKQQEFKNKPKKMLLPLPKRRLMKQL
jgi:hypothetical protein